MSKKFETQVKKDHYYGDQYLSRNRFLSFYQQIKTVVKITPPGGSVLEIGIGNRIVSQFLKEKGFKVTMCDFDKSLRPDVVADIRNLPLKENSFDTVLAAEILEHIPFTDVPKALNEIRRVTKRGAVVTLPYSCASFDVLTSLVVPYKKKQMRFGFRVPYSFFTKRKVSNPEHYWDIGRKGYSLRKILNLFKKHFQVKKHFSEDLNSRHHFFILRKKQSPHQ